MARLDNGSATPSAVARVIESWTQLGLPIRPGCSPGALATFEAKVGRELPADLREFLRCGNGLEIDENGFSFWPVEAYESFDRVAALHSDEWPRVEHSEAYFVFCDYLHWSWGYAIRLRRTGEEDRENPVVSVGMNEVWPIASSFSEFLELYLSDSDVLYPH